jgi:hypothetical protein
MLAHDLHPFLQNSMLLVAFALFWYVTWKYLMRERSFGAVRARSRVVAKVLAVGVAGGCQCRVQPGKRHRWTSAI